MRLEQHEPKPQLRCKLIPATVPGLLLIGISLLISACGGEAAVPPTATNTPTPTPSSNPTSTATPTQTATPTPTPEPDWYQALDPGLGVLKYHYAQVINPSARVYASLEDAAARTGNFGRLPNYPAYVAYSTTGEREGRNFNFSPVTSGWMDGSDLQLLAPSTFTGILLSRPISFRFGWVLAAVESTNASGSPIREYARYQIVHEVPAVTQKEGFIAVGADEWLPEEQVALVDPEVPPDAGENTCRFIYVNLKEETLTVYDRCQLVFASLVSSGANSWTFEGRFAILFKVAYSSITPPATSTSEYYIEGVPYFMTYAGNFGFHGAYWHDQFGTAASHGCINLSPADARWLFDWAFIGERVIISSEE
jgi:lipoprotein-anchoring transpeptidase ErfK/SrfK